MNYERFNTNTARIMAFAAKHSLPVESYNDGLQLRIGRVDFYPSTGKIVGGGKYAALPVDKKGCTKVLTELCKPVKPKAVKCDCHTFYCYDDRVLCLHRLFEKHIPEMITRESRPGGVEFVLWSAWNRWRNGGRWKLHSASEVQLAIDLAKRYNVPMQRI
jgi:hypothetical protein